jgi:hypothetical protein
MARGEFRNQLRKRRIYRREQSNRNIRNQLKFLKSKQLKFLKIFRNQYTIKKRTFS